MKTHSGRRSFLVQGTLLLAAAALATACNSGEANPNEGISTDWSYLGGSAGHTRYSPLDQIDSANFQTLQVAWTFTDTSTHLGAGSGTIRATPIYVDGMLLTVVGERRHVVRLDPVTGQAMWDFVEPETSRSHYSMRAAYGKGVAYGKVNGKGVVYISTPGFFLFALDAETGKPLENWGTPIGLPTFPTTGGVDLVKDLISDWEPFTSSGKTYNPDEGVPLGLGYITSSSPPIFVNGVVIVSSSQEQGYNESRNENVPGDILAYDAATGKKLWSFHVVPREGEFGHDTWEMNPFKWYGEVSSWAPMSADPERGLVYIPTNSGTIDFWGGHRPGDNLFGTSLIALDVKTGQRKWHYQLVHHDIWNYDTSTAPILMDVTVGGKAIPGVFQATKQGFVYAFNRETGDPIWPIEEKPVPQSQVPGEKLSPTQPFPTKPAPFERQGLTENDLIDWTPELRKMAVERMQGIQIGPLFLPPLHRDNTLGFRGALWCPGDVGGVNITGPAVADPTTGVMFITSTSGCTGRVPIPGGEADKANQQRAVPTGTTVADFSVYSGPSVTMPNIDGLPIIKPPYGHITAIDMNTGEHLWSIPHGDTPQEIKDHPLLAGIDVGNTGRRGHASMVVTPTMLMMTGQGSDATPYLYAVNKQTGARMGQVQIPVNSEYGMMTYSHEGKQYVVIIQPGDGTNHSKYVTLALPATGSK